VDYLVFDFVLLGLHIKDKLLHLELGCRLLCQVQLLFFYLRRDLSLESDRFTRLFYCFNRYKAKVVHVILHSSQLRFLRVFLIRPLTDFLELHYSLVDWPGLTRNPVILFSCV